MKFDSRHWLLNLLSRFTAFTLPWLHFADQSLFMTKELYDKAGGFREDHLVLEDHEMIKRLKRYTNFVVLKDKISIPSAKYLRHGVNRTEAVYALIFFMYRLGFPQEKMVKAYKSLLRKGIYSHIPMEPADVQVEKGTVLQHG